MADSKVYTKLGNGAVRDLTQDTIYNHPGTKQCNYEPDLSSCMIKTTISASKDINASAGSYNITLLSVNEMSVLENCLCLMVSYTFIISAASHLNRDWVEISTGSYWLFETDRLSGTTNNQGIIPMFAVNKGVFARGASTASPVMGLIINTPLSLRMSLGTSGASASGSVTINIVAY